MRENRVRRVLGADIADEFEAKMSESQAKRIAMKVVRKLATKTKKDRMGTMKMEIEMEFDGVHGFPDRRASHVARNITGICVHLRPLPPNKRPFG